MRRRTPGSGKADQLLSPAPRPGPAHTPLPFPPLPKSRPDARAAHRRPSAIERRLPAAAHPPPGCSRRTRHRRGHARRRLRSQPAAASIWPAAAGSSGKRPRRRSADRRQLHEAAVLYALPPGVPAPDLVGIHRAAGWIAVRPAASARPKASVRPGEDLAVRPFTAITATARPEGLRPPTRARPEALVLPGRALPYPGPPSSLPPDRLHVRLPGVVGPDTRTPVGWPGSHSEC
jgi:hypothetical protein